MLIINGKKTAVYGITLSNYLAQEGYRCERVAVELNGSIIPRSAYDQTLLTDNDKMEIVQFVGGG
jgi:sulfur carrier protein